MVKSQYHFSKTEFRGYHSLSQSKRISLFFDSPAE